MNSGTGTWLNDIWGSSSSDVFAVGGWGQGTIQHYDGSTWSTMSNDIPTSSGFTGIWGSSPSDVYVVLFLYK
jgi:hypothetical protein